MKRLLVLIALLFSTNALSEVFTPTENRTLFVYGVIDEPLLPVVSGILSLADGSGKDIDLIINSPGGSIEVGDKIIQATSIAKARGHKVRCAVVGMAASMAFSVLGHCSERFALDRAQLLYHPPRVFLMGEAITSDIAASMAHYLKKEDEKVIEDLLAVYPIDKKLFMFHYKQESWHNASELNADFNGIWIHPVEDITGVRSLDYSFKPSTAPIPNERIIRQYIPE